MYGPDGKTIPAGTSMGSEAARHLEQQITDLWLGPEIRRRSERGELPANFKLRAFQIVLPSPIDGGSVVVRLNEEVRAKARVRTRRPIAAGDLVYVKDIEDVEDISLLDEDVNCAHITGLQLDGVWITRLDFRYETKRSLEHLEAADEFLYTAQTARQKGRWRPFVENLFAAAELAAKAELMITPTCRPAELKQHSRIAGTYGSWARLGNAPEPSSRALSQLGDLRYAARYLRKPLRVDASTADVLIAAVREAVGSTRRRVAGGIERQEAE